MIVTAPNGITYYRFELLSAWPQLTAAAFARLGGVSAAPYESLNASLMVGDDPASVRENRRRMAQLFGWEEGAIVSARQVHGRDVTVVGGAEAGGQELAGTDSLITNQPGTLLLLKFADCVPVVIWDPVMQVVALTHAGWRGTVIKAPAAAVEAMVSGFGSDPADMVAGIGPSIGPCCYEVGEEVVAAADSAFGDRGLVDRGHGGKPHLDLWKANAETLKDAGIPANQIEQSGICTRCRNDLYFSHRAEGSPSGRFAVIAGIKG